MDDAGQEWTYPENHFDLVHTRIMNAFLQDWNHFFEQSFKHLKPGGWVECQELSVGVKSDDNTLSEGSHIRKWCDNEEAAWNKIGLSVNLTGEQVKGWMEKAGFVNVTVREFKLPIGTWPADIKLREIGAVQLVAMLEGLQGLTIAPWVRHLGYKEEEVDAFIEKVKGEWKDRNIHTYFPLLSSLTLNDRSGTDNLQVCRLWAEAERIIQGYAAVVNQLPGFLCSNLRPALAS